jgi:hypothetical protein
MGGDVMWNVSDLGAAGDGLESASDVLAEEIEDMLSGLSDVGRANAVGNALQALDEHRAALVLVEYICAMQPAAQVWLAEQILGLVANRARVILARSQVASALGDATTALQADAEAKVAHEQLTRLLSLVSPSSFGVVLSAAGAADAEG